MINFSAIAADRNLNTEALQNFVAARGWDFSKLSADDAVAIKFLTDVVSGIADEMKGYADRKVAAEQKHAALALASLTILARANMDCHCPKCSGHGRIKGFGHIEQGKCFQCGGTGVTRRARRAA